MNFNFNEDQLAIRSSVERIFSDLCSDEQIKAQGKAGHAMHTPLWSQLAETGILGLPFAERHGGMGLSLVELCLIIELQGKSVASVPLTSCVVEAGMTLADGENQALAEAILPDLIEGTLLLSPVRPYTGLQESFPLSFDGEKLHGRSGFSPYAPQAQAYLIEAVDISGAPILVYCKADAPGLECVAQVSISDEPAGFLRFHGTPIASEQIVAQGEHAIALLDNQRYRTFIAQAALQLSVLEEGLKRTAEYVSERTQFGRALGSFQAVSQQAADAYMEIESLRSVYWRALEDLQSGGDYSVSAAVAKYWVAEAGHKAAHTVLHLHGGIGQDLDYPIHRFFLFAKQCERYLGGAHQVSADLGKRLMAGDKTQLEQLCL